MMFLHDEKVFSLSKSINTIPYDDIRLLFQEFFCYLLIGGLYDEARDTRSIYLTRKNISDSDDLFENTGYRKGLGKFISTGLTQRFNALLIHPDLTDQERTTLKLVDTLFSDTSSLFRDLSARELFAIAKRRQFDDDMTTIAHYVSVCFGQSDFIQPTNLRRVYLSVFGNIHLSKEDRVDITHPAIIYKRKIQDVGYGSTLWALISSITNTLAKAYFPGNLLGEILESFNFLSEITESRGGISAPRYASALYIAQRMGIDGYNPIPASVAAYKAFLYGMVTRETSQIEILNRALLQYTLDLMMEKADVSAISHLFSDSSFYKKLNQGYRESTINVDKVNVPTILQFALEALEADKTSVKTSTEDEVSNEDPDNIGADVNGKANETGGKVDQGISKDDPVEDPQTDGDGYDPSVPPPAVPTGAPTMDKNNIGLISFDKSGEGVDENLYRESVVSLNDRIQKDSDVNISAEVKDALDYWVNGYLYRTAIAATKEQISSLGLQKYLKSV